MTQIIIYFILRILKLFIIMDNKQSLMMNEMSPRRIAKSTSNVSEISGSFSKTAAENVKKLFSEAKEFALKIENNLLDDSSKSYISLENSLIKFLDWTKERKLNMQNHIKEGFAEILKNLCDSEMTFENTYALPNFNDLALISEKYDPAKISEKSLLNLKTIEINMIKQKVLIFSENSELHGADAQELMRILEKVRIDANLGLFSKVRRKTAALMETTNAVNEQLNLLKRKLNFTEELNQEVELLSKQKENLKEKLKNISQKLFETESKLRESELKYNTFKTKSAILYQIINDNKDDLEILNQIIQAKIKLISIDHPLRKEIEKDERILNIAIQKFLTKSRCIHFFDSLNGILKFYQIGLHRIINITPGGFIFPKNFDTAQIGEKIFMNGGYYNNEISKITGDTFQFELIEYEMVSIKKLQESGMQKYDHKFIAFDSNTLYSLGGKNKSGDFIKQCERYNIRLNSWEKIHSLYEIKSYFSAVVVDFSIIYLFGGYNNSSGIIQNIECFSPYAYEECYNKWVLIKLCPGNQWSGRQGSSGFYKEDKNEIIIFGGKISESELLDEVLIFDLKAKTMRKDNEKLAKKEHFWNRTLVKNGNKMYIIGGTNKDLFMFDMEKYKYDEILSESIWCGNPK